MKDENTLVDAIGFNIGHLSKEYMIGDKIDIVGMLEVNSFNGRDSVQVNIKDVMKSF